MQLLISTQIQIPQARTPQVGNGQEKDVEGCCELQCDKRPAVRHTPLSTLDTRGRALRGVADGDSAASCACGCPVDGGGYYTLRRSRVDRRVAESIGTPVHAKAMTSAGESGTAYQTNHRYLRLPWEDLASRFSLLGSRDSMAHDSRRRTTAICHQNVQRLRWLVASTTGIVSSTSAGAGASGVSFPVHLSHAGSWFACSSSDLAASLTCMASYRCRLSNARQVHSAAKSASTHPWLASSTSKLPLCRFANY